MSSFAASIIPSQQRTKSKVSLAKRSLWTSHSEICTLFRTPSLSSFCFATFSIAGEMSHRVTEYPIFAKGSVILPVPPAASKIFAFLFLGRYPFRSSQSTWFSTAPLKVLHHSSYLLACSSHFSFVLLVFLDLFFGIFFLLNYVLDGALHKLRCG
jgi:hypothetical protein